LVSGYCLLKTPQIAGNALKVQRSAQKPQRGLNRSLRPRTCRTSFRSLIYACSTRARLNESCNPPSAGLWVLQAVPPGRAVVGMVQSALRRRNTLREIAGKARLDSLTAKHTFPVISNFMHNEKAICIRLDNWETNCDNIKTIRISNNSRISNPEGQECQHSSRSRSQQSSSTGTLPDLVPTLRAGEEDSLPACKLIKIQAHDVGECVKLNLLFW